MSIALFAISDLVSPVQAWARWLLPHRSPIGSQQAPSIQAAHRSTTPNSIAYKPMAARSRGIYHAQTHRVRPLRIERIVESGQPASHVGRMVMSGRMADVCAELDRLVASESARQ
jgi:hypothetical protein